MVNNFDIPNADDAANQTNEYQANMHSNNSAFTLISGNNILAIDK